MISTHILDTSLGNPAAQVKVSLERETGGSWKEISKQTTNADGRIAFNNAAESGTYRLVFDIESYFKAQGKEPFFLAVPVTFKITDVSRKYHVPLLLNPFGYSTYRGS